MVTESLTSADTDTEPEIETDNKLEQVVDPETTVQASMDSDTISVNLADVSITTDDTPETVVSISTAADDSDTVSVNLAATELASATAAVVPAAAVPPAVVPPAVVPPAVAFVPVRVPLAAGVPVVVLPSPPQPPPVVDSDSENEMAESQFNTQFAPRNLRG